jgi:hypothetical protein
LPGGAHGIFQIGSAGCESAFGDEKGGLSALLAGLGLAIGEKTAAAQLSSVSGIVGTWRMRFSDGPNRTAIQVVFVFIPGGVFLSLDSPVSLTANLSEPPDTMDYAAPNAGQWLQLPSGEVVVTAFSLNYDRAAVVRSEEWSRYTVTYNGAADTIAGTREWRVVAPDGRLLRSNAVPIGGTRVGVEIP